jgi:hypothetical protein
MTEPTGKYYAPGYGPLPGQPGYGEPIPGSEGPTYGGSHQYAPLQSYGGPQYGPPQYGPPQSGYGPPPARPGGGTVITAAVIQIAQASLYVLGALGILLLAGVVHSAGDEVDRRSGSDISGSTDSISRWVAVLGLLLLAGAVFMIVLAALAIRGRRWAAITSVVLQALAAVGGLVGLSLVGTGDSAPAIGLVFVLTSVAVAVLFLLPPSTAYFTARTAIAR